MPSQVTVFNVRTMVYKLNLPGGEVWNWMNQLIHEVKFEAEATCPQGETKELVTSHDTTITPLGSVGTNGYVRNTAPHALWVHNGTGMYGPVPHVITSPFGQRMVWQDYGGVTRGAWYTMGQRPQPWLRDALKAVEALHPALR